MPPRFAEEEFGRAGRGGVVAQRHADRARRAPISSSIENDRQASISLGGRADLGRPVPQLERRGDAEAGDATALLRRQRGDHRRQRVGDEIHHQIGRRIGDRFGGRAGAPRRRSRSTPDRSCGGRSSARSKTRPRDRARREPSVGRRGRATAPRARNSPSACRRFMIAEVDWTDEPGHARDLDLRQLPEAPDERKDQPLVVKTHARLVGAAGDRRRRRGEGAALSSVLAGIETPSRRSSPAGDPRPRRPSPHLHAASAIAAPSMRASTAPLSIINQTD